MSQLHIDQFDNLSLAAVDAKGNVVSPIPFDSAPVWTNSDDTAATLAAATDGLSASLTPVKAGGVTTVTVSASIAGTPFSATLDVSVVAGAVAGLSIVETFSPTPAVTATPSTP